MLPRRRSQSLVEVSVLMAILLPLFLGLGVLILSLYQASAVTQSAAWLGERLTTTGTACEDGSTTCDWVEEFDAQMHVFGLDRGPADTLSVTITHEDGTVRYFDESDPTLVPTTEYGDTVSVHLVKPVSGATFLGTGIQNVIAGMPGSSTAWLGVSQVDSTTITSGIALVPDFHLSYADTVVEDGPAAYWRLGEVGGTVFAEASGTQAADGTIDDGIVFNRDSLITGSTNAAMGLDGTASGTLTVPDSDALAFGPYDAFSVEMWLMRTRSGTFGGTCAGSEEPLYVRTGFEIMVSRAADCALDLGALDVLSVELPGHIVVSSSDPITSGVAHHIVVTYDGTTATESGGYVSIHLFLDGAEQTLRDGWQDTAQDGGAANRFDYGHVTGWSGMSGDTSLGAPAGAGADDRFVGDLDEVAVYAYPLPDYKVATHEAAGTQTGNVTALTGAPVTFFDMTNLEPDTWAWDFGDGETSNDQNPIHRFMSSGIYEVALSVGTVAGDGDVAKPAFVVVSDPSTVADLGFDYASTIEAAGPVGYWRLGESSGSTMHDQVGTLDGSYVGSPGFEAEGLLSGDSDPAVDFGAGDSAALDDDAALDTGAFSIEGWLERGRSGVSESVWSRSNAALHFDTDDHLVLTVGTGEITSTVALVPGVRYHIVGRYDGGAASLIVNDADVGAVTATIPPTLILSGDMSVATTFQGVVDELAFYDRSLARSEVTIHYLAGTGSPMTVVSGSTVVFADRSTGSPTHYRWDFGDGDISTDETPSHVYAAPGTYTVRLTVQNLSGFGTTVRESLITVE